MSEPLVPPTSTAAAALAGEDPPPISPARQQQQQPKAADQAAAVVYWASRPATVDGMLGGFPAVSRVDLQGSRLFLAKLRRRKSQRGNGPAAVAARPPLARAVDCGAGIGRITHGLLRQPGVAAVVDVVEPVAKFTEVLLQRGRARKRVGVDATEPAQEPRVEGAGGSGDGSDGEIGVGDGIEDEGGESAMGAIGDVFVTGLEGWTPPAGRVYDLFWNQWCLGHLADEQLVEYFIRCRGGLAADGWIIVKENVTSASPTRYATLALDDIQTPTDGEYDPIDHSVTRSDRSFRKLFRLAGLSVVAFQVQAGFPKELYPVHIYALQPTKS